MNTLKNISSEIIRQNWLNHKDVIYNSPHYELLWNSLESKFEIDKNDIYLPILKKFINAEKIYKKSLFDRIHIKQINNETLVLKGLYEEERKHIHLLCDKIGLHHESKLHPKQKNNTFMFIYKPNIWLWEYTEKNPYSESEEYYEKRQIIKKIKKQLCRRIWCICDEKCWKVGIKLHFCRIFLLLCRRIECKKVLNPTK
jgi:hypothetical protein